MASSGAIGWRVVVGRNQPEDGVTSVPGEAEYSKTVKVGGKSVGGGKL